MQVGIKRSVFTNQSFFLFLLIAVMSGMTAFLNPAFFTFQNWLNILNQNAVLGIVAAGATLVMISGNFDISVGSLIGFSTTFAASLVVNGSSVAVAVFWGLVMAILGCALNGVIVARTRTPSFIMTLATRSVYYGLALIVTGGVTQSLGGKFATLGRGTTLGIHNPVFFFLGVYVLLFLILRYTRTGRRIYAVGGNEEAAFLSGVNTQKVKILVYLMNGAFVGFASMVLLSRLGSALPSTGSGLELRAIAAVVIGGVPLTGGKGSALGTFLGVILMGLISNVLNLLNISAYYQEIAIGVIIAIAIIVSNLGKMRQR
ncbi:MAG: ABC transporter permease [Candidatus Caldatribacteriaceae bacterium]